MSSPIEHIVIAGGSHLAWWAAVFIKKSVPGIRVTLVNTPAAEVYAEVASAELMYLLGLADISWQDLMLSADGNFHSARAYFGWHTQQGHYFHAEETTELACGIIDFNQWLLKLKKSGHPAKLDDYLLAAASAKQGKIVGFEDCKKYAIGCSFDANALTNLLRQRAQQLEVEVAHGVGRVIINEQGEITAIIADNGGLVGGDFFIDVTGDAAALIDLVAPNGFVSWQEFFPCNRRKIVVTPPRSEKLIPFSSVQMGSSGWVRHVPLRNKVVSEFICPQGVAIDSNDRVATAFNASDEQSFACGYRPEPWVKNCLALGDAAVVVDYFSHSALHLGAVSLQKFVEYWPSQSDVVRQANEFNRLMRCEFEAVRDFHSIHYFLATNAASPFGRQLAKVSIPTSLDYRVKLFQACGRSIADEATLVAPQHWTYLLLGFECWPTSYDVIADAEPMGTYEQWAATILDNLHSNLSGLADYTVYMNSLLMSASKREYL